MFLRVPVSNPYSCGRFGSHFRGDRSMLLAFAFICRNSPPLPYVGHNLLIHGVSRSHTTTRYSRKNSSILVISSSQRPLPDNTQHSQQTNKRTPGGIRTHSLSRRAAADFRLRPRGGSGTGVVGFYSKISNKD